MSLQAVEQYMDARPFISNTVRFDAGRLPDAELKGVMAWVESLGFEPKDLCAELALVRRDVEWELHLSRFVKRDGRNHLDVARNIVVSKPVVVPLGSSPEIPDFDVETAAVPS